MANTPHIDIFISNTKLVPLKWVSFLDSLEKERMSRLPGKYKKKFIQQHAMLRVILSTFANVELKSKFLQSICEECGSVHAPPMTQELKARGYKTSFTHAGDLIALGVAKHNIGIDIDFVDNIGDSMFNMFLTSDELGFLKKMQNTNKRRMAARIWSAKEAASKADGIGGKISMKSWDFFAKGINCNNLKFLVEAKNGKTWRGIIFSLSKNSHLAIVWEEGLGREIKIKANRHFEEIDKKVFKITHIKIFLNEKRSF